MTLKTLLSPLLMSILFTMTPVASFAVEGGSHGGGGGDMESEFKDIAKNIRQWIQSGNDVALKLPRGITEKQYRKDMLDRIGSYSIEVVPQTLMFGGRVKTCVSREVSKAEFAVVHVRNQIRCNQTLFQQSYKNDIDGTYRLIHHEFAGLAGLEKNRGQDSDYTLSKQISRFLQTEEVRRLPIEPIGNSYRDPKGLKTMKCGELVLLQSNEESSSDPDSTGYGAYPSQVDARDFVVSLLKNKKSALTKALIEMGILFSDADKTNSIESNLVGEAIASGGGGRVEASYVETLVPISATGKRYEELMAYVRVREDYNSIQKGDLATDPLAVEQSTLTVQNVVVMSDPSKSFDLWTHVNTDLTPKNCHAVVIPKQKDGDIEL